MARKSRDGSQRSSQAQNDGAAISPAQCRAARGLLGWTQGKLANAAAVGIAVVKEFEAGKRMPLSQKVAAISQTMIAAGVQFIPENGGGAGVRLAARTQGKGPSRAK